MEALSKLITNRAVAWTIVLLVAIISIIGIGSALGVQNDDNLLAFLPKDNPEVKTFYDINTRFGGLEVALVGIESDAIFSTEFLEHLQQATKNLRGNPRDKLCIESDQRCRFHGR